MKRTKLNWVAEFGYLTCQTKIGLMGVYPIGEHFYWQCAAPGIAYEGSGLRDDLTQEQCVERAEQWYYDATHEYPDDGYVKLEPGQVVVKGDDVKELLHLWISHGPRFAEINRVMHAFAGAVALVECPICRGSGAIRVPHPMKPLVPDYIDNCDNCKGTGFVAAALDAARSTEMSYVTTKTAKWIVIAILFVAIAAIVLVVVAIAFVPACIGFGWRAGQALFGLVAGPAVAELKMAQRDKVFMAAEQARSNKGGVGE